jgi:CxxC motif-containing protein (DUF1111 family)
VQVLQLDEHGTSGARARAAAASGRSRSLARPAVRNLLDLPDVIVRASIAVRSLLVRIVVGLLLAMSSALAGPLVSAGQAIEGAFGDPLPNLSAQERARFTAGREVFVAAKDVSDGLGPVYNEDSCVACHGDPAVGGGSARLDTRLGSRDAGRGEAVDVRLLRDRGIGTQGACEFTGELAPEEVAVRTRRRATPLFGLGLVDAVPDSSLRQLAARQRARTPATAGRVHRVVDAVSGEERIGRFGWKAQASSLLHGAAEASFGELGITNPFFPEESCPQGNCALLDCDPAQDPEDDGAYTFLLADFLSLLAPPPRSLSSSAASVNDGRRIFDRIGCADCHAPRMRTGWHEIPALRRRVFAPYSDFLLHDMGTLGDGIEEWDAGPREMRTAPLWGLREAQAYLHDGRAETIDDAILAHEGQGSAARRRYRDLGIEERARLLEFLRSL